MKNKMCYIFLIALVFFSFGCESKSSGSDPNNSDEEVLTCTFMVASDMRGLAGSSYKYDNHRYFRGACEAAQSYEPDFVILAGDQDPIEKPKWTIDKYLGVPTVFTVGNHDAEYPSVIDAIGRENKALNIPGMSNTKYMTPATFSFDYENCHFLIVDLYENSSTNNPRPKLSSKLLKWIENDLQNSTNRFKFVVGHVPYENMPDTDMGTKRSYGLRETNIKTAEKFWTILNANNTTAYLCGHAHMYSHNKFRNVWQINAGVALVNTETDTEENYGSFVIIETTDTTVTLRAWRAFYDKFELKHIIDITN